MLRMSRAALVDRGLGRAADFLVVNALGCLGINSQAELGPGIIRKAPRLSPTVAKHPGANPRCVVWPMEVASGS